MATDHRVLSLGPDDQGRAVSADEFAEADLMEPWTYERENGRLIVLSPEGQRHLDDSRVWRQRLSRYWIEHPEIVEELVIQAWVRVDDGTDRIGDIGVYLVTEQPATPVPDRVPDLMIEVVSPGRESRERDYVQKRREYSRLGIRECVVSDRPRRRITVYGPGPRGHRKRILRPGSIYTSPLLPGLAIPVDEVLGG